MTTTTLDSTTPTTTPARTGRRWARLPEALEYTRLSERTLRRMAAAGRIRFYRPRGGRVLLDLDELDAALSATADDVQQTACG